MCLCQYTSHGHCGMIKENEDPDDGWGEDIADLTTDFFDFVVQGCLFLLFSC